MNLPARLGSAGRTATGEVIGGGTAHEGLRIGQ